MSTADAVIVARFWTRARRFPQLIGKSLNGERIWGGPYTLAQFIGGFLTAWILWQTRPIWGTGPFLAQLVMIPAITAAVVWLLGKVPVTGRNPTVLLTGIGTALTSPRIGRYAGQSLSLAAFVRTTRPLRSAPPAQVWTPPAANEIPTDDVAATTNTGRDLDPVAAGTNGETSPQRPSPARHRAQLTGVQQLLAAATDAGHEIAAEDDWLRAGQRVRSARTSTTHHSQPPSARVGAGTPATYTLEEDPR